MKTLKNISLKHLFETNIEDFVKFSKQFNHTFDQPDVIIEINKELYKEYQIRDQDESTRGHKKRAHPTGLTLFFMFAASCGE